MKWIVNKKKCVAGVALAAAGVVTVSTVVLAMGPGGGGPGGPGGMGAMGDVEIGQSVISVKLTTPTTGSLSRDTEFIGTIEPAESVSVYPEVSAKVTAVYFSAGDTVQAGDLLFEMDDSDAQLSYEIAQASYNQQVISADTTLGSDYESRLISAKSQLESAQQNLNNARLQLKDYNDGYDDSLLSAEKRRDQAETAMKEAETAWENAKDDPDVSEEEKQELYNAFAEAEAEYSMYRNAVNELEDDDDSEARSLRNSYRNAQTSYQQALDNYNLVAGASLEDTQKATEASLKSAELSLEQSASQLDKYKVYAPIGGIIESSAVSEHEYASTQTAAFVIANREDNLSVTFNATADAATALSIGDTVTVSKGGNDYAATITSIETKADESSGLFPIEAQLQEIDGSLLSGVSVKVTAATAKAENAMLIDVDNVYYEDGQPYVFTYADGVAHRTDIETGMSTSEQIVVESGLEPDSQIITTWHPDLADGVSVQLAEGQAAPEAAGEAGSDPLPSGEDAPAPQAPEGAAPADPGEDTAKAESASEVQSNTEEE